MSNDPHHDDDSLQGTSKSYFSVMLPACVVVTCHSHDVSAVAWSPNSADMMGMNQPFNLFKNMPDKLSIELNEKFSTIPHHSITELYRTQYCSIGNRAIEFQLYTSTGKCPHYRDWLTVSLPPAQHQYNIVTSSFIMQSGNLIDILNLFIQFWVWVCKLMLQKEMLYILMFYTKQRFYIMISGKV